MPTKHCKQCGKLFEKPQIVSKKNWKKRKFCSLKCRIDWRKKNEWKTKICPICKKEFRIHKYRKDIYCSKLCAGRSRPERGGRIEYICKNCGKKFVQWNCKKSQFCSNKCNNLWHRGTNNPHWKGGISRKNHRRETKQYKEWRMAVYRRDHFKCQDCGKHCDRANIVAHHLKSWDKYPKLRYEISNGITLCRVCHKLRH